MTGSGIRSHALTVPPLLRANLSLGQRILGFMLELFGLLEVSFRFLEVTNFAVRKSPIFVGDGAPRFEPDSLIIIGYSQFGSTNLVVRGASIVMSAGVLRVEPDDLVEVAEGLFPSVQL